MTMKNSINLKKAFYVFINTFLVMCMCIMPTYAWGRKLITKSISGSFWANGTFSYSLNATAGISYEESSILSQSDLSFSNISVSSSIQGVYGNVIPRQTSKYISGTSAVYVVQLTRNATGVYSDKVNYTLTYRASDSGIPYSLNTDEDTMILVDIEVSEPYDIQYLE